MPLALELIKHRRYHFGMQTIVRDKRGRFAKADIYTAAANRELAENLGLVKRRPVRAWISHYRWAILGYTAYVVLCLVAGAAGGYYGVTLGLK